MDVAVGQPAGWELLEQLHTEEATRDIPVLVTSTSPRLLEQSRGQAPRYGTTRFYLTKPLDLNELLAAVRAMTGAFGVCSTPPR